MKTYLSKIGKIFSLTTIIFILFISSIYSFAERGETQSDQLAPTVTGVVRHPGGGSNYDGTNGENSAEDISNKLDVDLGKTQIENESTNGEENLENEKNSKNDDEESENIKLAAFLIAAAGVSGVAATTLTKMRNKSGKNIRAPEKLFANLKDEINNTMLQRNGLWLATKDRNDLIKQLNKNSAIQFKVDEDGYVVIDNKKDVDYSKSMEASKLIISLINKDTITIVGKDDKFLALNSNQDVVEKNVERGISIGNNTTGHVIVINKDEKDPTVLFHELAHALDNGNLAINVENNIRKEIGLQERVEENPEDEKQFYNNYEEGEAYLEDLAKEIGGTVSYDETTETSYVTYNGLKGDFMEDIDGTYIDPETKKVVVKKKQFRYKLGLDLQEGEVYLRTYVQQMGGKIEWVEGERKAVISYNGQNYEIKVDGSEGAKIINDRMVLTKTNANYALDIYDESIYGNEESSGGSDLANNNNSGEDDTSKDDTTAKDDTTEKEDTTAKDDTKAKDSQTQGSTADLTKDDLQTLHEQISFINEQLSSLKEEGAAILTLASTGVIAKKYSRLLVAGARNKRDKDAYKGFIEGLKVGISEAGIDIKEAINNIDSDNLLLRAAGYIGRAAIVDGSEERKVVFGIVSEDMERIGNLEDKEFRISEAKTYGKAFVTYVLSQSLTGGLLESLKGISSITEQDITYNEKIGLMKYKSDILFKVYKYLNDDSANLNELVFKTIEKRNGYELILWDIDMSVFVNKEVLSVSQEASLYKLSVHELR